MRPHQHPSSTGYGALVKGEDGGLHIRHFLTPADAARAARGRELLCPSVPVGQMARELVSKINDTSAAATTMRHAWTPAKLAARLGLSVRTINRRCEAGELPYIDHGTVSRPKRYIPAEAVQLILIHGLRGVGVMCRTGLLRRPSA
jgi:hypothetical protein